MSTAPSPVRRIHLVTGKLAEPSLRDVAGRIAAALPIEFTIDVMPITVAALMTPAWIAARIRVPPGADMVLVPGYCAGDLDAVRRAAGAPVKAGPKDLHELPEFLGQGQRPAADLARYDIEILAEINYAPRLTAEELLRQAQALRADGADVIDLGCEPGQRWSGVANAVRMLRSEGLRVSIDSFDPQEVAAAATAGAELVLSVNHTNRHAAADWGVEVVAIPDRPDDLGSLEVTLAALSARNVKHRIDPILEPIGFGFAESLSRYLEARRRWPGAPMLMGVGNLTELTDVDSAGVNTLLLGFCQELGIHSVLTTQVIPWCRTAVRECDLARRLVRHAVTQRTLPKHVEPRLVTLRDPKTAEPPLAELDRLAAAIRDRNFRLFAAEGALHAVAAGERHTASDPFTLWQSLQRSAARPIDADHAFYLGYELCKALTALTLGKTYRQDEALRWGYLTRDEPTAAHRRGSAISGGDSAEPAGEGPPEDIAPGAAS